MDFISNLIKRPISLVRSDSQPSTPTDQGQISQPSSRPTTPHHSHSPLLPFDRATTPESRQQHIANALNGCLVASDIMDTLNKRDEFRPIAAAAASRASPPISRQSPIQPISASLQTSSSSSNDNGCGANSLPTTTTTTGNTIEELLIQINDNLSKGDLHATAAELSQQHLPNRPLSASPSALTLALSSEFNAICSKSANLKGTSSTESQESLPSESLSPPLKSAAMAPVADNAPAANIITTEKGHCDIEPKVVVLGVPANVALKTDSNVDKINKSSEVHTDLSEPKISEMPTALNFNAEDRAKLTFEDGLIPTLTAAINEHENRENVPVKDESNSKPNQNLQVHIEPDTATSSDNETFAECQSYQALDANNDYGFIADEYSFENSEIESYFSAANSRNVTLTNVAADPLSLPMNKLPEQSESDLQSMLSALSSDELLTQQTVNPLDVTFGDEPMDVDVSFAEIIVGGSELPINNGNILPSDTTSVENVVETKSAAAELECQQVNSTEMATNNADPIDIFENEAGYETTPSHIVVPLNKSFEIPTSTTEITGTPSQAIADMTQSTVATTSVQSANTSQNPIDEYDVKNCTTESKLEVNKSLTGSHNALNLTNDMNSSTSSCKSSASSPSFPIKHKGSSIKQFPRSPTATAAKSMPFLEKSEYTERIEIERKRSTASEPKLALCGSRKTSTADEKPAQVAKSANDAITPISANVHSTLTPNENNSSTVGEINFEHNSTFDGSASVAPLKEGNLTDSFDKRRTFTVAASVPEETEIPAQKQDSERDKRRTFNMPSSENKEDPKTNISEAEDKRHTFNLKTEEPQANTSEAENKRRTFNLSASMPISNTANNKDVNIPMDIDYTLPPVSTTADNDMETKQAQTPNQSPTTTVYGSPPIPTIQNRTTNAPLPLVASPPIPTLQNHQGHEETSNVPIPAAPTKPTTPKLHMDDDAFKVPLPPSPASSTASPPMPAIQKRPSIHAYKNVEDAGVEVLSAKEQTKRDASDEKDVVAGYCTPSPMEEQPCSTSTFGSFGESPYAGVDQQEFESEEFQNGNNIILNQFDFDYLLTKGNNSAPIDRSSILLKFDPLLGVPVPANQIQQLPAKQSPQIFQLLGNNLANLGPTIEEDEHSSSASLSSNSNNQSFVVEAENKRISLGLNLLNESCANAKQTFTKVSTEKQPIKEQKQQQQQVVNSKHASMSVDVIKDMNIDNDCNKSFENSNSQTDEKQINYKMDELEKKIKNEVLKTEDIEKKLKEAEQREEALIKRITEKDKTITKMTGVIEAYEKAIAELIAEKEQLIQSYEKQLAEVKADRDSNYQHLTSLETTFADLHVKYGKSKEMTLQLKSNEEALVAEKRQIQENLRLQGQRYDKMKNHAMQQLEIANKKLESLTKEHNIETTKLKALLKKEEISRASINEQLQQKSRENAELVKICDELINGQGS
ncbi:PREDICTED: serine-rich adhesin for platelets-like isoform X2 [Rhagoletis zephyria]|uniref:serine-rich adhesin for platelets-like isoform X2 n=1 Tax=Rhagoletis zephyria TaxID=28612 RepID=UPI000811263B|nr:PREDICTED: serine-rich adhesin for platelets-like isoform X2 [Rhagoletis zephyria]